MPSPERGTNHTPNASPGCLTRPTTAKSASQPSSTERASLRMTSRQSSAAPEAVTMRAERTSVTPSMLVKACATFLVLSPSGSFANQHSTTRKRSSVGCGLSCRTFSSQSIALLGPGTYSLRNPVHHVETKAVSSTARSDNNTVRNPFIGRTLLSLVEVDEPMVGGKALAPIIHGLRARRRGVPSKNIFDITRVHGAPWRCPKAMSRSRRAGVTAGRSQVGTCIERQVRPVVIAASDRRLPAQAASGTHRNKGKDDEPIDFPKKPARILSLHPISLSG